MKKITLLFTLFGLLLCASKSLPANDKVPILHQTGNGGCVFIEVSVAALPAHLDHGDIIVTDCHNITVQLDASGHVSVDASDINPGIGLGCGITSIDVFPSDFDCSNIGDNTVTLRVTVHNKKIYECQSIVTVEDLVSPNALCKNIIVQLDGLGSASITAADVDNGSNDACGIASLSVSPDAFNCSNVGQNTATLTITDNNGNQSSCNAIVTIEDNIAPEALCQNVGVTLSGGAAAITASQIDNGSSDACGIASMNVSPASFTCENIGDNTVTLTVTDNNGNVSTCSAAVTVVGAIPTCSISISPSLDGGAGISAQTIYLGYGPQSVTLSASGGTSYSWSSDGGGLSCTECADPVFEPQSSGFYTLSVTITNEYGCQSTCGVAICVIDARAPGHGSGNGNNEDKVLVCHIPPGNPENAHTISISLNAVPAHLDHGDYIGPCGAGSSCTASGARSSGYGNNAEKITIEAVPNPFSDKTTLLFTPVQDDLITVEVYDINGRLKERLYSGYAEAGLKKTAEFNGGHYGKGIYFYKVISSTGIHIEKIVLIK